MYVDKCKSNVDVEGGGKKVRFHGQAVNECSEVSRLHMRMCYVINMFITLRFICFFH